MTFIVITAVCIVLIITRIIYQYQKGVSIDYYIKPILWFFVIINLVTVAAIESNGDKNHKNIQEDYTIALDISESMKADVQAEWSDKIHTRSDLANQYAKDLIQGLLDQNPQCRINLIVFWGRSFEVASPTNKKEDLINAIDQINPNMVNRQKDGYDGSDISQVLLLSQTLKKLHNNTSQDHHKTFVITDGDHNRWVDVYEMMPYITHPVFIIPIGSASWEVFTINNTPQTKNDGSPVILITNTKLLSDIAQKSWWAIWKNAISLLNSLSISKQKIEDEPHTNRAYTFLIFNTIVLLILFIYLLSTNWYFNISLTIWTICLTLCLWGSLFALQVIQKNEYVSDQDASSTIFLIDRNKDRSASIETIQQYSESHSGENITIKYHDKKTQTIYSGKTQTSDLQALLNLVQSLSASDALWWERNDERNSSQLIQSIEKQEANKNSIKIAVLAWIIVTNLCLLISPIWILRIWRLRKRYQRW